MARIESVNLGREQSIPGHARMGSTGIFKHPETGRVTVGSLGLAGDHVHDKANHGGPDQAVYLYFAEDYAFWSAELGHTIAPGTFGENLIVSGIDPVSMAVGDRLQAGELVLEVTAPRIPCGTLAARMDDPEFVKRFRAAERPGAYCRVVAEGAIAAGEELTCRPYAGDRVTLVEIFRAWFVRKKLPAAELRRILAAPVAERVREDLEGILRQSAA